MDQEIASQEENNPTNDDSTDEEDASRCTDSGSRTLENKHKPLVFKELKKIWEKVEPCLPWEVGHYDESNTLLLDDSPYKALLNPAHTAVFPFSYTYLSKEDNSLGPGGDLRVYMEHLAVAENVQKYVQERPFGQQAINETSSSWPFYKDVLNKLATPIKAIKRISSFDLITSEDFMFLT
ncbi:hypothetical protein RJ641_022958 [Dillenia turbinata]|uniref:Mitochondrial import inner membrane translocase subunit TIM50 n=1 Tax=Dillenia turbinata TaxID=194707 RepID=A0AAN8UN04_9MAGN